MSRQQQAARRNKQAGNVAADAEDDIAAHAGTPADAEGLQSFASETVLAKLSAEWPGSRLADVWNSFAGVAPFTELKPVKKFTRRKAAVARIWARSNV